MKAYGLVLARNLCGLLDLIGPTFVHMDERVAHNQKLWDQWTDQHVGSRYYDVEAFRSGRSSLLPLEVTEVGDVRGKSLLHLQCHFGMDTLSWARAGATATGVDLSERAIAEANKLAAEVDVPATFVASDVYALQENLTGSYDLVVATWGILSWLPDLSRWAEIVASFVTEGGAFYLADAHPIGRIFDDRYPPVVTRSYFREGALESRAPVSYADPSGTPADAVSYMWLRPVARSLPHSPLPDSSWSTCTSCRTACSSDTPGLYRETMGSGTPPIPGCL